MPTSRCVTRFKDMLASATNLLIAVTIGIQTVLAAPPDKHTYWDRAVDFTANLPLVPNVKGELTGEITFIQNTLVGPNRGNRERPLLVTDRGAYLLFMPSNPDQESLHITFSDHNRVILTAKLQRPIDGARSDFNNKGGKTPVVYNKRAWTTVVPWHLMHKGISISVTNAAGQKGVLPADSFEFGAPIELVTQNIQLGMLVPPSRVPVNRWCTSAAHELTIDYFQHVPVARFIAAQYLPIHFDKVVMPNGSVYTHRSTFEDAGVYKGDMRENIAKGLVSTGINLANVGVLSSAGGNQKQPRPFRITTVHTTAGLYTRKHKNGMLEDHFVTHGLSGGGGQLTLNNTTGNQYSHEYGHDHGLGHYPGKGKRLCYHSRNGAWGYHIFKHRLIANLSWNSNSEDSLIPYGYGSDAMAGGSPMGPISVFTLHTPYSLKLIQNNITKQSGILDASSSTGYSRWDEKTQKLVEMKAGTPKPDKTGIPVMTLVGFYDPQHKLTSYIFPALYGNWGNIFSPEAISDFSPAAQTSKYRLIVEDTQGSTYQFPLSDIRFNKSTMNQFHVNLDASKRYSNASIVLFNRGKQTTLHSRRLEPPHGELPEPAIVGKKDSFGKAALHLQTMSEVLTQKGYPNVEIMESAMSDYYGRILTYRSGMNIASGQTCKHENKYYQAIADSPTSVPGNDTKLWRFLGESTPFISDKVLALGDASTDYTRGVMKQKSFVHYYVPVDYNRVISSSVSSPSQRKWYGKDEFSRIVVLGTRHDGVVEQILLRGQINNTHFLGYGAGKSSSSRVRFTFNADDNPGLSKGSYAISFYAYAHGWHTNKLVEAFEVRGNIEVE